MPPFAFNKDVTFFPHFLSNERGGPALKSDGAWNKKNEDVASAFSILSWYS
jgi:hypothetical protein